MNIFSLAWREVKASGGKLRLVFFILFIGLVGPLFSSAVKSSVDNYLETRSRRILSADLAVNSLRAFEPVTRKEITERFKPVRSTEETEFVTMARGRDVASLVSVKGVDANFPLYGDFVLEDGSTRGKAETLSSAQTAWVYPEVLAQLGLKVGDEIGIGKLTFKIESALKDGPGIVQAGGFAPRVYIARKFVEATGLTLYGAQVFHRIYLELPQELKAAAPAAEFSDPDVFVRTPDDSTRGFERFFRFFNLYLVSITMIVFVLSWMGAFYILQIFLQERLKNAAIYMINGGGRWGAAFLYCVQVLIVMLGALAVAGVVVEAAIWSVNRFFGAQLPIGFVLKVSWRDWLTLTGVTLISAIAFNGPFLARLSFLKLQSLLGESALGIERMPRAIRLASYVPLVIVFFALATWLMNSWTDALRIAGGMLAAGLFGWIAGRFLFKTFFTTVRSTPGFVRLVATTLSRSRFGVNLCFLALVLVGLSLNLVPHMLKTVVAEISPLQGKEVPALFLLNIPESGVEDLKTFASKNNAELRFLSPLILARLDKIAGHAPTVDRFQKFPVRLSFREERIPSETIVEGRELPGRWNGEGIPEVSVEENFAERSGIKLGDELEFDIQSIPITAKVTSLRSVKWTSFNPNFFIMMQPGVLDDAPKSFIANVNLDGADEKVKVQYELSKGFPDISVIDIGRTIEQVLTVAQSVIGPVTAAAWIAVAMSFLILLGVIAHNLKLRDAEIDIEKILGADSSLIRSLIVSEYAVTAFFAWIVGAGSALVIAWLVAKQVFALSLSVSWLAVGASLAATLLVTIMIAWISSTRVLRLRGASRKL